LTIQDDPFIAPSCLLALPAQHWQGEQEQVSFSAVEDCGKMEGGDGIMKDVRTILTVERRQQNLTTRWSEPRLSRRFRSKPTLE
jgi:hypothetical protein